MLLMMATAIVAAYFIGKEDAQSEGLSKESILKIAGNALKKEYGLDANNCNVWYDKKNKHWVKYYAKDYPKLVGHSYLAINFSKKYERWFERFQSHIGGGPYWICVDRTTGEILASYGGM